MEAPTTATEPPGKKITVEPNIAFGFPLLTGEATLHLTVDEATDVYVDLGNALALGQHVRVPRPDEADELEAEWLTRITPRLKAFTKVHAEPPTFRNLPVTLADVYPQLLDLFHEFGTWESVGAHLGELVVGKPIEIFDADKFLDRAPTKPVELSKPEPSDGGALDVHVPPAAEKPKSGLQGRQKQEELTEDRIIRLWTAGGLTGETDASRIAKIVASIGVRRREEIGGGSEAIRQFLRSKGFTVADPMSFGGNRTAQSNTHQTENPVQTAPETAAPANDHQIKEAARLHEKKPEPIAPPSDMVLAAPPAVPGIEPAIMLQIIHGFVLEGMSIADVVAVTRVEMDLVCRFGTGMEDNWSSAYKALPPFKRKELDIALTHHYKGGSK